MILGRKGRLFPKAGNAFFRDLAQAEVILTERHHSASGAFQKVHAREERCFAGAAGSDSCRRAALFTVKSMPFQTSGERKNV